MPEVKITVKDSPIKNAIDQYYGFLRDLFNPTDIQNIALNSTLVTFDIVRDAPLYNENVFRSFTDRKIGLSPTEFGPGSANFGDRFSERYQEMIEVVVSDIDRNLSEEDQDKIENYKRELRLSERELEEAYLEMNDRWQKYKTDSGITNSDPEILEKQIAYYNTFAFATKLRRIKGDILQAHEDMSFVRMRQYPDQESRILAKLYRFANSEQYKVARPVNPRLEADDGYDDIKLAQLWIYGNLGASFDVGANVRPSGHLENFLDNQGKRGFSIRKKVDDVTVHDSHWKTSGSARKWFFWKVSAAVEHKKHYESSIKKVNSIQINFENVAEYWVNRGRWYSSAIFDYGYIKEYLDNHPDTATDLSYAITSAIIGRGLTITVKFESTEEFETWSKLDVKGSASFSLFGINVPGGASGYNSYDFHKKVDTAAKTVTFVDSSDHCRLLGFRVEKLFETDEESRARDLLYWEETMEPELEALSSGKISFKEFLGE